MQDTPWDAAGSVVLSEVLKHARYKTNAAEILWIACEVLYILNMQVHAMLPTATCQCVSIHVTSFCNMFI